MSSKRVTNFSDLVQRVTASCLLHPLGSNRFLNGHTSPDLQSEPYHHIKDISDDVGKQISVVVGKEISDDDGKEISDDGEVYADEYKPDRRMAKKNGGEGDEEEEEEVWAMVAKVFESVSRMKRAYGEVQEAHNPWDEEKMRVADGEVVGELRRLGVMRERLRRRSGGGGGRVVAVETVREAVAPYEEVVEELKREVRRKEEEVGELKEKIKCLMIDNNNGRRSSLSRKKPSFSLVPSSPSADMFEATMNQVREKSKSFTSHLLSLMRSAHWDISAAIRSIESAMSKDGSTTKKIPTIPHHHHQAKHALESYILRKIFQGFDHETFYMDGTLSSLLNPCQFRQDCFSKFRDMKSMDPSELLGILPNCPFGVFSSKKYQDIVHPKMEESLFGNLEQRNQILNGSHPRTQFYSEFLGLAKAVWLLHLLAFSLDPPPSHFEASRGAEFHPVYMESVVRFPGGTVPSGQVVGFPVSPGFKLRNGSVVKARVYLVPRN